MLVFCVSAGFAAASCALVYLRGDGFLGFLAAACVLVLTVLIINDRSSFSTSRRTPRRGEARVNFSKLEVAVLFALLMLGVFVGLFRLAT